VKIQSLARSLRAAGLTVTGVVEADPWDCTDGEITLTHGAYVQVGEGYAVVNVMSARGWIVGATDAGDEFRTVVGFHWPLRYRMGWVVMDAADAVRAAQVGTYAAIDAAARAAHERLGAKA
jgi:hypothetical protein